MDKVKARPALFRALGANEPPTHVQVEGREYALVIVFKHDSWAATARYSCGSHEIVCKFNRQQSILGIPMRWLGHALARREAKALATLDSVIGIPRGCGPVTVEGTVWNNVVAHDYIEGHPLAGNEKVTAEFFPQLLQMLKTVHQHDIAYVDLHKRENILVDEARQPWLIDFQVCYSHCHKHQSKSQLQSSILQQLQSIDLYHLTKHVLRHRPEQVKSLGLSEYQSPPGWIRSHRKFAVPLRSLRRTLLAKLNVRARDGMATSEVFPEDAVRREKQAA